MPSITLSQADITSLNTAKIFNDNDYTYLALWYDSDPSSMTQIIDADDFYSRWGIDNGKLLSILRGLEAKKQLTITPSIFTLTWTQAETTGMTQAEVLEMYNDGVINLQAYIYYALLLTKGAGLQQTVDPATYAIAPWKIQNSDLITQINALAGKTDPTTKKPTFFTVDLSQISITWLA